MQKKHLCKDTKEWKRLCHKTHKVKTPTDDDKNCITWRWNAMYLIQHNELFGEDRTSLSKSSADCGPVSESINFCSTALRCSSSWRARSLRSARVSFFRLSSCCNKSFKTNIWLCGNISHLSPEPTYTSSGTRMTRKYLDF